MNKIEASLTKVNKSPLRQPAIPGAAHFSNQSTAAGDLPTASAPLASLPDFTQISAADFYARLAASVWSARKNLRDQTSRHSLRALIELTSPLRVVDAKVFLARRRHHRLAVELGSNDLALCDQEAVVGTCLQCGILASLSARGLLRLHAGLFTTAFRVALRFLAWASSADVFDCAFSRGRHAGGRHEQEYRTGPDQIMRFHCFASSLRGPNDTKL